jgi:hypothetical protein
MKEYSTCMGMSGKDYLKDLNERKERAKKKDPMKIFNKTTKKPKMDKKLKY